MAKPGYVKNQYVGSILMNLHFLSFQFKEAHSKNSLHRSACLLTTKHLLEKEYVLQLTEEINQYILK